MSDVVGVGNRIDHLTTAPAFQPISKVIIHVKDASQDEENYAYEAGNTSQRTLEIDNPFGTGEMARDMLARLRGFQYRPYAADGAILNPAAELGDFANASGVFSGIFNRKKTFGRLMRADISAPTDEEINHEYQFESTKTREYYRIIGEVKSRIDYVAEGIKAEVVSKEGGSSSSFSWLLKSDSHTWYSQGREVMKVDNSGLTVKGTVLAASGTIGGFTITNSAIYKTITSMTDETTSSGVYIGTDGIRLGSNFKVTSSGNLEANSAVLKGTLIVGDRSIQANDLRQGAEDGYNWTRGSYGGYSAPAQIALSGATGFINATRSSASGYPPYFTAGRITAVNQLVVGGIWFEPYTLYYRDRTGKISNKRILAAR